MLYDGQSGTNIAIPASVAPMSLASSSSSPLPSSPSYGAILNAPPTMASGLLRIQNPIARLNNFKFKALSVGDMNRGMAMSGGIAGAVCTGISIFAFTSKHMETVRYQVGNYYVDAPQQVTGYPEIGAIFLIAAIIGFVLMIIGLVSKPETIDPRGWQRSKGLPATATATCIHCGQKLEPDWVLCPRCGERPK